MSFTGDSYIVPPTSGKEAKSFSSEGVNASVSSSGVSVNRNNAFAAQDYAVIIKAFETSVSDWSEEDYNLAYHYKDVYSTRKFSEKVQKQLNYYPGLHQTSSAPSEDPAYTEAKRESDQRLGFWDTAMSDPSSFMSAIRSRQQDFDYSKIFSSDTSAKTKAEEIGKVFTECVPCIKRLMDIDGLVPNGDLLEVHALNVKIRTDFLKQIRQLFDDPGLYIDICELIKLLAGLCPQDLFAISILLTQYLAKLNLEIKFNIDFIISLVGSILSPFIDALSQWLDKWIQLILEPIICVVNNVNEVILLAQNAKIPLANATASATFDIGIAAPAHRNTSIEGSSGYNSGSAWSEAEVERFNTPDKEKYNTPVPEFPEEEINYSKEEFNAVWEPSYSEEKRERREEFFNKKRDERSREQYKKPVPLKRPKLDGTRWSKDDIPESEKDTYKYDFRTDVLPPENQSKVLPSERYWDPAPLASSIIQVRNILQSGISYIQDWFEYITQMIYDLLGTEIGWMKKKTGTTVIKSRIIQLLKVIQSIINAVNKNGLECGVSTNLDPGQIKFITEQELNIFTDFDFTVQDNGDISLTKPGQNNPPDTSDNSQSDSDSPSEDTIDSAVGEISTKTPKQQKTQESSIIVKSCFNVANSSDVQKVRDWIAYVDGRIADET